LFHVIQAEDDPDSFFFYEIYTDAACLDTHREALHYKAFYAAVGNLVADLSRDPAG
jgi:quinol monooxygenase YgiN